MPRVARLLIVSALLIQGILTVFPMPRAHASSARQGYALCAEQDHHRAFVRVDTVRRVLICAFKTMSHREPNKLTPQLLRLGDTLFVSAVVEVPPGQHLSFPEVTDVP